MPQNGAARILANAVLTLVAAGLLLALWLTLVGGIAAFAYGALFQFDALDPGRWRELYRWFLGGGTVAFGFAALAAGLGGLALLGTAGLVFRLPSLSRRVKGTTELWRWRPPMPMPRSPRLRKNRMPRRHLASPKMALPGAVLAVWRRLVDWGIALRRLPVGCRRSGRPAPSSPVVAAGSGQAGMLAEVIPPGDVQAGQDISVAAVDPEAVSGDDDLAAFGRAITLFEVWSEPPPGWICEALRDELAGLSAAGWRLFAEPAALRFLDLARVHRLLPEDPATQAALDALCAARPEPRPLELVEVQPVEEGPPPAPAPIRMSLSAAWLCELLDNFEMLEALRSAESGASDRFDAEWGGLVDETRSQLTQAMRGMADDDWASLDHFPDRARRVRILTDRLREEFRDPACGRAAAPEQADEAPQEVMERLLEGFGFQLVPSLPGPAEAGLLLARRAATVLILRLQPLQDRRWRCDDSAFGPWRASDGTTLPSPCRAVWQRLALLAALDRDGASRQGVVVVIGGTFIAEEELAAELRCSSAPCDVGLVWLDAPPGRPLPSLRGYLEALSTPAATAPRIAAEGVA